MIVSVLLGLCISSTSFTEPNYSWDLCLDNLELVLSEERFVPFSDGIILKTISFLYISLTISK